MRVLPQAGLGSVVVECFGSSVHGFIFAEVVQRVVTATVGHKVFLVIQVHNLLCVCHQCRRVRGKYECLVIGNTEHEGAPEPRRKQCVWLVRGHHDQPVGTAELL